MNDWRMQRDEVTKLISAYKKHKCLWDYRSNEYKLYDLKRQAWQQLGRMFGKEAHVVKRKIKCLRSVYGCEKRKVENSYGTNRIYQPNLFYYKDLNFLDSVIINRKTTFRVQTFDPMEEFNEPVIETTSIEHDDSVDDDVDEVSPPSSLKPPQNVSHFNTRKRNRLTHYSNLDAAVNSLTELTKTAKTSEESVYTSFGETIALQLSQLPAIEAIATMSEIHQILSNHIVKFMLSNKRKSCANCETKYVNQKLSVVTSSSKKRRKQT